MQAKEIDWIFYCVIFLLAQHSILWGTIRLCEHPHAHAHHKCLFFVSSRFFAGNSIQFNKNAIHRRRLVRLDSHSSNYFFRVHSSSIPLDRPNGTNGARLFFLHVIWVVSLFVFHSIQCASMPAIKQPQLLHQWFNVRWQTKKETHRPPKIEIKTNILNMNRTMWTAIWTSYLLINCDRNSWSSTCQIIEIFLSNRVVFGKRMKYDSFADDWITSNCRNAIKLHCGFKAASTPTRDDAHHIREFSYLAATTSQMSGISQTRMPKKKLM